jgi:5'-nucleotidase
MHILVTNDDGVQAPGLLALVQAMRQIGDVTIVAPERNWSGGGHVKTIDRPLRARQVKLADGTPALSSDGAPSDCVALALLGLIERPIDMVVSGINSMANLGHDVTYSGTVTAAMEAIIWDVPAIAFSLDGAQRNENEMDFSAAARIARLVVRKIKRKKLPKGILLNVNVPYLPLNEIKGIRNTKQGMRVYRDRLDKRQDPRGHDYYWIGGDYPTGKDKKGTDIGALARGYVSVTPLQLDLTAYPALASLGKWDWQPDLKAQASLAIETQFVAVGA